MRRQFLLSALLGLLAVGLSEQSRAATTHAGPQTEASWLPGRDRRPTNAWPVAAPESRGVDTNHLAQSLQRVARVCPNLRSLLVVRHGRLILERYFGGTRAEDAWNVKSVTKSVLSALVGIALERGHLRSLDQRVLDFFPEYQDQLADPRVRQITLRHLLTMSAGLEWEENGAITYRWLRSPDWVRFTLTSKCVADAGTKWNYSSALPHLLSAVLTRASGTNLLAFARLALFDPLGADVGSWTQDPQGYYYGGSELCLTPRDMARFGYLYLNQGQWNGKQIVPAAWVRASTQQTNSAHYGYLWWLDTFQGHPMYFAQGLGGQHIVVVPDLDAVVVTTSFLPTHVSALTFIKLYILPCLQTPSTNPIPLPSAPQIVERYLQAVGGRERLAALKSLRIAGTRQVPSTGEQEPFEMLKGPSGKVIYSGLGDLLHRVGVNQRIVWASADSYRLLGEEEARYWRRLAGEWTDWVSPSEAPAEVSLETYAGKPAYRLRYTADSGETTADFFDAETGLLAASVRALSLRPYGRIGETVCFTNYRDCSGLRVPTRVVSHIQGPESVFTRTSVQCDRVDPRVFDLPIPIEAILKGKRDNGRKTRPW